MAEAGDTGVATCEIAAPAALRSHDELDVVTGRVAKADERFHLALFGLLRSARVDGMAERFQCRGRNLQAPFIFHLKTDGLVARVAFRITQRVRALVGPEIEGFLTALSDLQAQAGSCKAFRLFQIWRTEADIAHILQ